MPLHDIDATGVETHPRGMGEAPDLSQTVAVAELENLLGVTCTGDDPDGAQRPEWHRLAALAAEAYRRDLLSKGQLARLLRLDRVGLRKMLDAADIDDPTGTKYRPHEAEGTDRGWGFNKWLLNGAGT